MLSSVSLLLLRDSRLTKIENTLLLVLFTFPLFISVIMAVIKANAYGHGSVPLAKYLQRHGSQHFAVASAQEGEELRQAGITGNIHVLGG